MMWEVQFHAAFEAEVLAYERDVRIALIAVTKLLSDYGPQLGRPYADTLKGSKHSNMKELRFEAAEGEWRAAFAFDPQRRAILLVAGDKSGRSQKLFYRRMIAKADFRFSEHLESLKTGKKEK
ncbi:addiction module toxin RelE [Sinorhizobium sp. LM21]|nr:addiction module toxin RelE [Sinorhizobium sp. LM21]